MGNLLVVLDVFRAVRMKAELRTVPHSRLFVMDVSVRDKAPAWLQAPDLFLPRNSTSSFTRSQVCVEKPSAANVTPLVCGGKISSLPGSGCTLIEERRGTRPDLRITAQTSFYSCSIFEKENHP